TPSIKAACSGDLAWAVVLANPNKVSHVLTMDMTGRDQGWKALHQEMFNNLQKQGGQYQDQKIGEKTCRIFTLPNNIQIAYGVKDDLLIVVDHIPTLQDMLLRWAGNINGSLANSLAYRRVSDKTRAMEREEKLIRWYFEPILRMEAQL